MTTILILTGECGGGFDVMSAIEKVTFSNKKTGFTHYSLSSTGAWCTPDGDNSDPWLELVFQNVVKIFGVTVGGFGSSTFSNFKVGHKLLGGYVAYTHYGTVLSEDVSFYIFTKAYLTREFVSLEFVSLL